MTRVLLVDDHQILREGLRVLIEKQPQFTVVGEAENGAEAVELVQSTNPDVIVMDVAMPEMNGIQATRMIKKEFPQVKVLGLSMYSDSQFINGMLASGASGYLLKDSAFDDLVVALQTVLSGKSYLSPRIADLVMEPFLSQNSGDSDKEPINITEADAQVLQLLREGNTHNQVGNLALLDPLVSEDPPELQPQSPRYKEACDFVLQSITGIRDGEAPDLEKGYAITSEIAKTLESEESLLLEATDRKQDFSIITHSVNVSILATKLMQVMARDPKEQANMGLAALLHEVGVVNLDNELLYKAGELTQDELHRLRQRPQDSADLLGELCPDSPWLSEIVGQVYERADGTGHPNGLFGKELSEEGQVLGVIDMMEARMHRRPFRGPQSGYESMLDLVSNMQNEWSSHVLRSVLRTFSLYPYNQLVLLNTRDVGQVIRVSGQYVSRPVVRVLYDEEGRKPTDERVIDLSKNTSLSIIKALEADELTGGSAP